MGQAGACDHQVGRIVGMVQRRENAALRKRGAGLRLAVIGPFDDASKFEQLLA